MTLEKIEKRQNLQNQCTYESNMLLHKNFEGKGYVHKIINV